jgi:hypothetical protein
MERNNLHKDMFKIYYIIDYQEKQAVPLGLLNAPKALGRAGICREKSSGGR